MASSSVSQESLDRDDILEPDQGKIAANCRLEYSRESAFHGTSHSIPHSVSVKHNDLQIHHNIQGGERRMKNNVLLHKGKNAIKDKRKLREKRRSTGMVQMASTESTGDSLDEDVSVETRRNTTINESSFIEESCNIRQHGNKSPSDLEADFEDNQDYDSTLSQSESNPVIINVCSKNNNSDHCNKTLLNQFSNSLSGKEIIKTDHALEKTTSQQDNYDRSYENSSVEDRSFIPSSNFAEDSETLSSDRYSLVKLLEQEKEEKLRLEYLVELKEQRIEELERKLALLC